MKTRIVYPQMWLDEKFAQCKQSTKLLFCYLINNQYLGLSRYTRISDRKISFDTGLNSVQINEGKTELATLKWCFFKEEWIYHNHNCAYVDYVRNERVAESKQKEVDAVPLNIVQYFNESCLNNVQTLLELKSETINKKQKEGGVGETKNSIESLTDEFCTQVAENYEVSLPFVLKKKNDLILYCRSTGKRYKDYQATLQMWVRKDKDGK